MTTLLERDDLRTEVDEALVEARQGSGSLLLVGGEAGAGKTSLVQDARQRVDAIVLWGACDPLSTPRPLSPLMDFALSKDAGLEELRDPHLQPSEMFTMVLEFLRGRLRPVFMILEDVHWADDATLDFLRYIGRRVGDTNAVVACTYRDDEVGPSHPLTSVLAQLAPIDSTRRLKVPPLSLDAVTSLAEGHDLEPADLFEITGGNAFYVTEVLAVDERIPASVEDAVLARVHSLSEAARKAVEAVSIAPRALEIDYIEPLSGAPSSRLEEALDGGVLESDGDGYRFRHELAREAVETSIPTPRRLSLHRKMVDLLEENDVLDLARVAHHSIESGSEDLIVEYGTRAASEAVDRGSHREAASFYDATLAHGDAMDPGLLAGARVKAAYEYLILDRVADGLLNAEMAAEQYSRTGQILEQAEALRVKSTAQWALTETVSARATVSQIIELLEPFGPSSTLAKSLYNAAHFQMLARHYATGMAFARESRLVAVEIGDDDARRLADHDIGCLQVVAGDIGQGFGLLRELVDEGLEAGDSRFVAQTLSNLGSAAGEVRVYETAVKALEECITFALDHDEDAVAVYDRAWLARIAFEQGRWDDVEEYVELVESSSINEVGIQVVTARGALGRTRVRRGDEGGRQLLEDTVGLGVLHEVQHVWPLWCGIAEHSWLWGQTASIPDLLGSTYERALDTDSPWAKGEVGFWMWMAGAIGEPPKGAAEPYALHMSGDWSGAADAWRSIGCPYEAALALADSDQAAQLEALSVFDSLGARPAAAKLRETLRYEGAENIPRGPVRETVANPANLTARQLEVATLMLDGLTNANIADRLFVSKKTVEHHISAIFAKLGVESRAAAIAEAASLLSPKIGVPGA